MIEERIPDMTDKELENLRANAVRLAQTGSVKQKPEAERLLPLIDAAMESRKSDKAAALAEKKKARPKPVRKTKAKAAVVEEEAETTE
jgi:hypothetical protein